MTAIFKFKLYLQNNTKFVVDPQVSRIALRKPKDDGFEGTAKYRI